MNSIANELKVLSANMCAWHPASAVHDYGKRLSALADRIEQEDKARAAVNEMTRIAQENGEYGKSDIFEVDRLCGELSDIFIYTGGAIGKTCDEARDMIRDLYEAANAVSVGPDAPALSKELARDGKK